MMRFLALMLLACLVAFVARASAQEFETKAKFGVLMDYESGTILLNKNADERLEPASMAKLMTLAVVFTYIQQGKLSLDDEFFISENAWRTGGAASGGSTMFAELNSQIRVEDLIRSVIIQSGNDAAIALAEGIGGTEQTFSRIANQLAKQIGLNSSHFVNSTGLPDPDQYSTARDLATLARYLIQTFPEFYAIFAEPEFTWNKIRQLNRNSLLETGIGVDGLKTGHTEASGYGEVISAPNDGRRLIAVIHGLETMRERTEEGRKLITWGMRGFELLPVYAKDQVVAYANVYGGKEPNVGLVGKDRIDLFLPKGAENCPVATVTYKGPLRPPVLQGQQVGKLNIFCADVLVQETPLYATATVEDGDLFRKSADAAKHLLLGWLP
ncbi:MAG: D-alanyl-D-alanine carboxypeptidase [Devosia sp.]|uniref:D-alanyl-D-alanine carboxypeptidase family protein n=1 Tax=Devosia sp. TaxID=1871048 RepID=UPI001A37FC60|nr:D-alanyl-D-alanine carboxypeptidase family protein [Devosia sp.]MBL8597882.1 D-alanyl-D-alanine carboxypeptidase [Devosia sp.]